MEDKYMANTSSINAIANLSTTAQMPPCPGHGTLGKKVLLYANYFKVSYPPELTLTRCNVEIQPEVKGKKLSRVIALLLALPRVRWREDRN